MRLSVRAPIVLAALVALAPARRAEACDCVPPPPPRAAMDESAAVFEGELVALEPSGAPHMSIARFAVKRHWKGVEAPTVEVRAPDASELCGMSLELKQSYIVYATRGDDGLRTGLCTRTRLARHAAEDHKALGKGQPPPAALPAPAAPPDTAAPPPAAPPAPPAAAPPAPPPATPPTPPPASAAPPAPAAAPASSCALAPEPGLAALLLGLVALGRRRRAG